MSLLTRKLLANLSIIVLAFSAGCRQCGAQNKDSPATTLPAPDSAGKQAPWLKDIVSNPDQQPQLRDLSARIELSAKVEEQSAKGLTALRLHVVNNTERPLSFNGNEAVLALDKMQMKAAPMAIVSAHIQEYDNPHGYRQRAALTAVTAAMTIGAWQAVSDDKLLHGPVSERYGFDNANRNQRLLRFGERVLWPGDSSDGLVYFENSKSAPIARASLQLPVADFYKPSDRILVPAGVK